MESEVFTKFSNILADSLYLEYNAILIFEKPHLFNSEDNMRTCINLVLSGNVVFPLKELKMIFTET